MESLKSIFLGKKNVASIHLQILTKLNLRNLPSEQRKVALNLLIQTMKKYYQTLQFDKINQSNLHKVLIQYNQLCYQKALIPISNHFRINLIDQLNTNFNDRPVSSSDRDIDNKKFNKVQFEQRNSLQTENELSSLMAERKSLYHQNNNRPPTPDFLKAQKVGKIIEQRPTTPEQLKSKKTNINHNNNFNDNENENISNEEDSETFADFDNYPTTITNDDNFVEDDMSFEERLKKIEREREQPVPPQVNNEDVKKLKETFKNNNNNNINNNNINNNIKDRIRENINKINEKKDELRIPIKKFDNINKKDFLINTESVDIIKNKFTFDFGLVLRNSRILTLDQMEFDLIIPNMNDEEFRYMIDEKEKSIKVEKGYYTINKLINRLNKNNDIKFMIDKNKIIIEPKEDKDFRLISSNIGDVLGLANNYDEEGRIEGDFPYKLKNNRYIKLYLDNINSEYHIIDLDNPERIRINLNNLNLDELQIRLTDMNDNLLEILRGDLKMLLTIEYQIMNEEIDL